MTSDVTTFRYFQAPRAQMSGLARRDVTCSFCDVAGEGFTVDERTSKYGCFACLAQGRFGFFHDTEVGLLLGEGQLESFYDHNEPPPDGFSSRALIELYHTPQFVSIQQAVWLTHCDDFMAYIGTWLPRDFAAASPVGDARSQFIAMARTSDAARTWDTCVQEDVELPDEWVLGYYAFRCLHCNTLAGNWDFG